MSTTNANTPSDVRHQIDERIESLERVLIGLVPRSERLAIVAQVESRAREFVTDGRTIESENFASPIRHDDSDASVNGTSARRRSRIAVSSGMSGILAIVLLMAMPVTYIFLSMFGEAFGETFSYVILGMHTLALICGGTLAVTLGLAGLIRLAQRRGRLTGHGWAITGICAGPLPVVVGCLVMAMVMASMFSVEMVPGAVPTEVADLNGVYPSAKQHPSSASRVPMYSYPPADAYSEKPVPASNAYGQPELPTSALPANEAEKLPDPYSVLPPVQDSSPTTFVPQSVADPDPTDDNDVPQVSLET